MKLIFFGTSPRSARFLELALKNGLKIDLVVSAPPKKMGKKQVLTENPVVTVAKTNQIRFFEDLNKIFTFSAPTIGVILDFNEIIPVSIINHFQKGIVNIHFSKLPQYRGPAPVQYTILNGEKEAWISYILISEKLDEGKIISQTFLPLTQNETTEDLYQKLLSKSAGEIKTIISDYFAGKLIPSEQKGEPSYTRKLMSENCRIDWSKSPSEIDRLIRAAYPEPGVWTSVQICLKSAKIQKRLKILKTHLENGKLMLDLVQLEGKKPVTWKQFREGYPSADLTSMG